MALDVGGARSALRHVDATAQAQARVDLPPLLLERRDHELGFPAGAAMHEHAAERDGAGRAGAGARAAGAREDGAAHAGRAHGTAARAERIEHAQFVGDAHARVRDHRDAPAGRGLAHRLGHRRDGAGRAAPAHLAARARERRQRVAPHRGDVARQVGVHARRRVGRERHPGAPERQHEQRERHAARDGLCRRPRARRATG
jgi:hypothetical protein